ncbi:DUF72 domain-containing protein [Myxococcota bacterium]|nr:DUF72 domain-containing protein [Myxococcota bacterium]MBU1411408.1 DUF72 domain-containing protein [Myxococcota bacterium]MBU1510803.1 DUF72 domain-containing protein [Myxococcota bacterium]
MNDIRVGTSGFDYLDWIGNFYPKSLPRKDFLSYYARFFGTLELNFSYYRMPDADQLASLRERVPPTFDFSVKAHESLTHRIDPDTWQASADEFSAALAPLMRNDQLAAVLLQFPFSFHYEPDRRRYLRDLLDRLQEFPCVVEFRNVQWMTPRVFEALTRAGVGLCAVDAPDLPGLPPSLDRATSDLGYVRFHGRNEANWWGSDGAARYDYRYSLAELSAWLPRLDTLRRTTKKLRVHFNNHRRGQATDNARDLIELIVKQLPAPIVPAPMDWPQPAPELPLQ